MFIVCAVGAIIIFDNTTTPITELRCCYCIDRRIESGGWRIESVGVIVVIGCVIRGIIIVGVVNMVIITVGVMREIIIIAAVIVIIEIIVVSVIIAETIVVVIPLINIVIPVR